MIRFALMGSMLGWMLAVFVHPAAAAVDPALLDLVPGNAEVLYGVSVQPLIATSFGKVAYTRVLSNNPSIDRFAALVGMDPKRDVHELLLVTLPPAAPKLVRYDLVLVKGSFRVERFVSAARLSGAGVIEDHGITTIEASPGTLRQTLVFVDSSTAMIGPAGILKEVVARRAAKNFYSGALKQKAAALSGANELWFVASGAPAARLFSNRPWVPGSMVNSVREILGGAKFQGDSATLTADATTTSETLSQVGVQALNAAVRLIKNPRSAPLRETQFSASGPTIRATLTLNDADFERLLLKPDNRKSVMAGVH